ERAHRSGHEISRPPVPIGGDREGMKKQVRRDGPRKQGASGSLHPEVAGLELDTRRVQRLETVEGLKTGRTPLQVIEVAERAAPVAEQAIDDAKRRCPPPPLACRAGCDWCCHLTVGTTVPEVVRIAAYLRQTLSPEELQAIRQRIAELEEHKRRLSLGQRADAYWPCALLVNHRCAAY